MTRKKKDGSPVRESPLYHNHTDKERDQFLDELRKTANVTVAASKVGWRRRMAYRYRDEDTEFAKAWDEAVEEGLDLIEEELRRRAVDGIDKPLAFKGELTGDSIKEYSDTLLIFFLKGKRPQVWADLQKVQQTGEITFTVVYPEERQKPAPTSED